MHRLVPALLMVLLARPLWAQSTAELELTVTEPGSPNRLDCTSVAEDGCQPLNVSSCAIDERSIEITVEATERVEEDSRLLVFLTEDSDCTFSDADTLDGPLVVTRLDESGDPLVSGTDFFFPEDSDEAGYETAASLLEATQVCADPQDGVTYRLCFVVSETDAIADSDEPNAFLSIRIDTQPPPAPETFGITPLDGRVEVNLESDEDDLYRWNIAIRQESAMAEPDCREWDVEPNRFLNVNSTEFTVDVQNGVPYEICAYAEDTAGNRGEPSSVMMFSSVDECDFIECYPVELESGCAATPTSLWWLVWLPLLLSRRHGRMWTVGALLLLVPARSMAQSTHVGVQVGAYKPQMDGAGQTYERYFGSSPSTMLSVDFDRLLWDLGGGKAGIVLGAGYSRVSGSTLVCDGGCTAETALSDGLNGADENRLSVMPLTAGLSYRFGLGADPDRPIVIPFVKAGLSAVYWQVTVGGSRVDDGWGMNLGVFATAGAAFDVSWLEPRAPKRSFLRGTYLVVQASHLVGDGFDDDRLDLSDSYLQVGLAVDY